MGGALRPDVQFEVPIEGRLVHRGWTFLLNGRIDQLLPLDCRAGAPDPASLGGVSDHALQMESGTLLREIKSVTRPLPAEEAELRADYPPYFLQLAAYAVLQRPDVCARAVSGAPVTDWRDYDTHYTERYLGLPDENPAAYAAASPVTFAGKLARPLLLVHGTADDNVYFLHALKLSSALFLAGRPHEFLPLSGFTHMVVTPETTSRLYGRIADFLLGRPAPPPAR